MNRWQVSDIGFYMQLLNLCNLTCEEKCYCRFSTPTTSSSSLPVKPGNADLNPRMIQFRHKQSSTVLINLNKIINRSVSLSVCLTNILTTDTWMRKPVEHFSFFHSVNFRKLFPILLYRISLSYLGQAHKLDHRQQTRAMSPMYKVRQLGF